MSHRLRVVAADAWLTAPRQNLPFEWERADLRVRDPENGRPRRWASKQVRPQNGQQAVNCVLMRGGTSKGLFFLARDLPPLAKVRDRVLLAAMGSPDNRQIDGCGGDDSLTSKVAILAPSTDPNHEVDYLFAQVMVDRAIVDTTPSCGNILAGVACYAIEEGLVVAKDPYTRVRIRAVNNRADVEAIVQTPRGQISYEGDQVIDGVPGTGSPIVLNFRNVIGARTGKLLPTGNTIDIIDGVPVTCLDVAMPMVILRAEHLLGVDDRRAAPNRRRRDRRTGAPDPPVGLVITGHESPAELNRNQALLDRLEQIRRLAALKMGLGDVAGQVTPKVAVVSKATRGGTFTSRYFVPEKCHATHAVTGAIGVASASVLPGSIFSDWLPTPQGPLQQKTIQVEHPVGRIPVHLEFSVQNGHLNIERAGIISTARRLFEGRVLVPARLYWPG